MTALCSRCIHKNVCHNYHIMETVTDEINKALDCLEVDVEGEAYRLPDIPWLNLNGTAIHCKEYHEDNNYKMAMQMAQANANALAAPNYSFCAKPYNI